MSEEEYQHIRRAPVWRCYALFFDRLLWMARPIFHYFRTMTISIYMAVWTLIKAAIVGLVMVGTMFGITLLMFVMAPFGYTTDILFKVQRSVDSGKNA